MSAENKGSNAQAEIGPRGRGLAPSGGQRAVAWAGLATGDSAELAAKGRRNFQTEIGAARGQHRPSQPGRGGQNQTESSRVKPNQSEKKRFQKECLPLNVRGERGDKLFPPRGDTAEVSAHSKMARAGGGAACFVVAKAGGFC
jgi:hypothetical protein